MVDLGFNMIDLGFKMLDLGFECIGLGFKMVDFSFKMIDLVYFGMIWDSKWLISDSGLVFHWAPSTIGLKP